MNYPISTTEANGARMVDLEVLCKDFDIVIDFDQLIGTTTSVKKTFRIVNDRLFLIDGKKFIDDFLGTLGACPVNLGSCFSFRKICFVYSCLVLTDLGNGPIFEGGVYFGGNTIFMSKALSVMGSDRRIFSFDTFEGMPKPLNEDVSISDGYYKEGHFSEATYEITSRNLASQGISVENLFKGRVDASFGFASFVKDASLGILDMDSYEGIYHGLRLLSEIGSPDFLAFIDDTSIPGVSLAIDRVSREFDLQRTEVTTNVTLVRRRHLVI